MRRTLTALLVAFALVGCQPGSNTEKPDEEMIAAEPAAAITSPEECAAMGGSIRPVCKMQTPTCVITYTDVGKSCSDDADCQGKCLLEGDPPAEASATVTGMCQADSDPCGCRTEVLAGKAQSTICVD